MSRTIYDYLNSMETHQLEYILWLHEQHNQNHGTPETYDLIRQLLRERWEKDPENPGSQHYFQRKTPL